MDRKIVELLIHGTGVNEIAKTLHIAKRRIRTLRKKAKACGYLDEWDKPGSTPLPAYPEGLFPDFIDGRTLHLSPSHQLLEPHRSWIKERLEAGWHLVTVYEELPVPGISRSSFYRYLARNGLNRLGENHRVIPEIIHMPGSALLLDWGKLCDVTVHSVAGSPRGIDSVTGKKAPLWIFVGVLGFSRYMMVRLVWTNDTITTLKAIESMFQELGGVPHKLVIDNPKCFALIASKYEPLLNPAFERFASHFSLLIECLPPGDPQKKGKVERSIPYVRRLYEAHGSDWKGLEEAAEYMGRKIVIANERRHGTTFKKPRDLYLNEERNTLKPLPNLAYEVEQYHEGLVRKDGHVRFQNKYYSVDEKYVNESVIVLGDSKQVSIYHKGSLLEVHPKITDPYRSKSTKTHHLKPWERALEDHSWYRERAARLGPHVEEMIVALLKQGHGFIDTRKIWGILSLDKRYPGQALNAACQQAIALDSLSYRTVKGFLELGGPKQDTEGYALAKNTNKHKFIHPLSDYEAQMGLFAYSTKEKEDHECRND